MAYQKTSGRGREKKASMNDHEVDLRCLSEDQLSNRKTCPIVQNVHVGDEEPTMSGATCNKTKCILFDSANYQHSQFHELIRLNDTARNSSNIVMCCDVVHKLLKKWFTLQFTVWDPDKNRGQGGVQVVGTCLIWKGVKAGLAKQAYVHAWNMFTDALTRLMRLEENDQDSRWVWTFQERRIPACPSVPMLISQQQP
jgi:hypothetical protein